MIVIFVMPNVMSRYNFVGILEVLFIFNYLFFIWRTHVSAIKNTRGLGGWGVGVLGGGVGGGGGGGMQQ